MNLQIITGTKTTINKHARIYEVNPTGFYNKVERARNRNELFFLMYLLGYLFHILANWVTNGLQ